LEKAKQKIKDLNYIKETQRYDAESIKVLEGLEAVRKRPAMYIGSTGPLGLHHLVYEVVDNSVDESLAGYCNNIEVVIHTDNSITITDDGRGIPVKKHPVKKISTVEVVLTELHAGGKFENKVYKVSGGLHGVGLTVVNFLSEQLDVEIKRDGKVFQQRYRGGIPKAPVKAVGKTKKTGTRITFKPDSKIFDTTEFSFDTLSQRLRELSFLNAGIKISVLDERTEKSHQFQYKGGISTFVEHLNKNKNPIHPKIIYFSGEKPGMQMEISLQWNDSYSELKVLTYKGDKQLLIREEPPKGPQSRAAGRRCEGGARGCIEHKARQPAVRGADQDKTGKLRGRGLCKVHSQRKARGLP
jgi:DNA gyrase subunit B